MILPNEEKELMIQWVSYLFHCCPSSLCIKCVSCLVVIFDHEKDLLLQLMSILLILICSLLPVLWLSASGVSLSVLWRFALAASGKGSVAASALCVVVVA